MVGTLHASAGIPFSNMRVLGSYALVYVTDGGGRYQLRGQPPIPCGKGDLLVIFPEIAHAYGPDPGGKWSEVYVVFEGAVFDLWRRHGILSPEHPVLRLAAVGRHARILWEIVSLGRRHNPARKLDQVCKLQSFLASALAIQPDRRGGEGFPVWPPWVVDAAERMTTTLPIESIAHESGMSYESFRKKFRAITGDSPGRYRNRIAVDLARQMIYEQRLSNKELAERLGFCDEFHFSRRFRQITGQSPRDFRRSLPKDSR
jgi:AraC-like DNA-binding protein